MKKILIVDDLPQNLELLQTLLCSQNFEVLTAHNGQEALQLARRSASLDLVITDILMPVMDGYALCREWKKDPQLQKIPLIFYSATYTEQKDIDLALSLGGDLFIVKPELPDVFLGKVKSFLSNFSADSLPAAKVLDMPEPEYQQLYSQRLVKKLENKHLALEKANRELREEAKRRAKVENLWERTINSIDDIVTLQDQDMHILKVNNATLKHLQTSNEELIGKKCYELFSGFDHPCEGCPVPNTLEDYQQHTQLIRHERLGKTFLVSSAVVLSDTGEFDYLIHIAKDITDLKNSEEKRFQLEAQLRQKYKMEALGVMAGGVAHNFNNNLAIILGNIELSRFKLAPSSDIRHYLDDAQAAIIKSRDLVLKILAFGRQGTNSYQPVNFSLAVEETLNLVKSTIPESINLKTSKTELARDAIINADSGQIGECVINLANNAVHAMAEKGDLWVHLDVVDIDKPDIPVQYSCSPGNYVVLSVKDSGTGMTAEVMEKIFDPFYTTKEVNQGTGMGLSTLQGIVDQHGGFIKVNSEYGKGSCFELYFPVIKTQKVEMSPQSPPISIPAGHERILFVDDDEMLAHLGKRILEEVGYQVTAITDSEAALEMFRREPEQFQLVITDQTMPNLTGTELAVELLKIRADLPIILMTGYSSKVDEIESQKLGIKAFCMKPVDQLELTQIIREVLDTAKG